MIKTKAGVITTREYDDGIARGIQVLLNDEVVCMIDVLDDSGEARVLVYSYDSDEPTDMIKIL